MLLVSRITERLKIRFTYFRAQLRVACWSDGCFAPSAFFQQIEWMNALWRIFKHFGGQAGIVERLSEFGYRVFSFAVIPNKFDMFAVTIH
jgi:hypothetical protein